MTGLTIRRFTSLKYKLFVTSVAVFALVAQPLYGAISASVVNALSTVHTTNLQGWDLSETLATGHNQLVAGGLRVWTESNGSTDKAAGYYATPGLNLSDVDSASIDFTSFDGGRPGLQLKVDRDGDGNWDGNLVYEPWANYGDGNWWTNKSGFGVANGGGYPGMGTLTQYQAANPNAKVQAVGYSLGAGVKGDVVISKMTFGETSYTFDLAPLAVPTNLKPVTGTATNNPAFPMTWNSVAGATKYEYRASYSQLNATTLGNIIYTDSSESGANYTLGNPTITRTNSGTPAADYFWQVRAGNTAQWSDWSEVAKVTTDYTAPTSTNNLPSIISGTVNVTQKITDNIKAQSGKLRIWKLKMDGTQDNTKFYAIGDLNVNGSNEVMYTFDAISNLYGDGSYIAKFTATDAAGNASVSQANFRVDGTKPTIAVKGVTFGNNYTPESVGTGNIFSKANFKLSDNDKIAKAYINTYEKSLTPSAWSDVNDVIVGGFGGQYGNNVIRVQDTAGNESTYAFILDDKKPTVTFKTGSDTVGTGPYSRVSLKLFDEYKIAKAYVNDKLITLTANTWSDLNDITVGGSMGGKSGNNTVKVYDLAGNVTDFNFVLDNEPPMAPALKTTSPYVANGVSKTLEWNVSPSSDVAYYEYAEYNGTAPNTDTSLVSWTKNVDGTSTTDTAWQSDIKIFWRVRAVDTAGNRSAWSETRQILTDRTKPVVLGSNEPAVNPNSFIITATDNFGNDNIARVTGNIYKTAGNSLFTSNSSTTKNPLIVDLSGLPDGEYYIKYNALDKAGNVAQTKLFSFSVDNTAPEGSFTHTNNNDNTVVNTDVISTLTTTEPIQTPAGWTAVTATTFIKTSTSNNKGWMTITDFAGNSSKILFEVKRIDKTNPTFNIADNSNFTTSSVEVVVNEENINKIIVNDVAVNFPPTKPNYKVTVTGEGVYTLVATDKAGNESTVKFTINTPPPAPTINTFTANGISGTGEPGSTIELSLGGMPVVTALPITVAEDGSWSYIFTPALIVGSYNVAAVATDGGGSSSSATRSLTVATTSSSVIPTPTTPVGVLQESTGNNSTSISTLIPAASLFSAAAALLAPGTTPAATDDNDNTVASVQGLSTANSNQPDDTEGEVKAAEDTKASWSLGNLVLTAISVIAGLMALLGVFRKRETDEITHTALRAVVIVVAAGTAIAYVLTNDFAAPMAWFSMWSIAYAVAVIAQVSIIANLKGSAE